ncbi:hypothetical protein SEVIR_4G163401v4 [Setaria viridis]|uniref:Uncharacterized protein n=1 Tax=Setaria viridis TaxID=4556 RepID=A0A4U6UXD1_SETVI|nr:hypothetical protein SEVIR_4G163401v2 [Setaria viridis]
MTPVRRLPSSGVPNCGRWIRSCAHRPSVTKATADRRPRIAASPSASRLQQPGSTGNRKGQATSAQTSSTTAPPTEHSSNLDLYMEDSDVEVVRSEAEGEEKNEEQNKNEE